MADDAPEAAQLSTAQGWAHSADDWRALIAAGHGIAVRRDEALVATALCFGRGDIVALGLIIVAAEHRGNGLGRALTTRIIEIADARTLRLIATPVGARLYRRLGFVAGRSIAHYTRPAALSPPLSESSDASVRPMNEHEGTNVERLVAAATGQQDLFAHAAATAEAIVVAIETGRIVGVAMRRPLADQAIIGPVIAETPAQAIALIVRLSRECPGRPVRIDWIEDGSEHANLAALGFAHRGDAQEMWRRANPETTAAVCAASQFALASQALG
ncbi:MAG: GNAT family N-acetyltransferase [Salinisphaera sp.]